MNDQTIEGEIQAKGLTAPRVTPADVEAEIASEHYFTAHDGVIGTHATDGGATAAMHPNTYENALHATAALRLLTFCVLVLRNGFTVTAESACASPENFDAEIGRRVAREKAIDKVWPLLGFRLRDHLHAATCAPVGTWLDRVRAEHDELVSKRDSLESFLRHNADEPHIAREQVELMWSQLDHMAHYASVLAKRIAAAEVANG